jgi:hypothetical protein
METAIEEFVRTEPPKLNAAALVEDEDK